MREIFDKLMSGKRTKGLSPDEVELNSYLEEEKRDQIKEILGKFREKKNRELILGNTLIKGKKSILDAEDILKNNNPIIKQKKILHSSNTFLK